MVESKKKIAFLFLIIDNPNFPKVWDYYFKGNEDKINIYIHPKYPEKTIWHQDRIINNLQETAWGYIVGAYKELFLSALQDKDNYKFVTISESCIPIKPFDEFYKDVTNDPHSWIKLLPVRKYDWYARISSQIISSIGKQNIIKHYARMCLSRHHIKKILFNKEKLNLFIKMHVGDEFFLSSITPLHNFKDIAVTFDDWDYIDKEIKKIREQIKKSSGEKKKLLQEKFNDTAKNPKTIVTVSKEDLSNIKTCGSYFYRKFDKKSDIENYIYQLI